MADQRDTSIWPFLCLLTCLFVLSATTPRAWEKELNARRSMDLPARGGRGSSRTDASQLHLEQPRIVSRLAPIPCVIEDGGLDLSEVCELLTRNEGHTGGSAAIEPAAAFVPAVPTAKLATQHADTIGADPADPNSALLAGPMEGLPWLSDDFQSDEADEAGEIASNESRFTEDVETATGAMPMLEAASIPDSSLQDQVELAAPIELEETDSQSVNIASERLVEQFWSEPKAMFERLEGLAWECETGLWARDVTRLVRKLARAMALHSDESWQILGQLDELCHEGDRLAAQLADPELGGAVRRARHSLQRRVDIWAQVAAIGGPVDGASRSEPAPERLRVCLAEVESLVAGSPEGRQWQRYLELDALRDLVEQRGRAETERSMVLATEVLQRLADHSMTAEQRKFVAREPLARLRDQLRQWAVASPAGPALLRTLEQFEQTGAPADARALATDRLRLAASSLPEERELADRVEAHYRNANVRFTVAGELLDRFMPERKSKSDSVQDYVLGNPVRGTSMTTTDMTVQLVPDRSRLRFALVIRGLVASETSAFAGPATFFNSSTSAFAARKDVELGVKGFLVWPASVAVENDTYLRGLQTDFDDIPVLGSVVQEIALSQKRQKEGQADREVKHKLAARVNRQVDTEVGQRLGQASARLENRLFGPLSELSLGPTVISAETDEERMTMRLRIAAPQQLGANTPRPQALVDSLASVQVHESALNNFVERLELGGGTFTVEELRKRIATRLKRPEMLENETDYDEDVVIAFAPENAVQVRCQDGQIAITLAVATLWQAENRWDDFQVQAFYRPEVAGGRVELVRDGVVYLIGEGLNMRSQIALRGIFSKTFSKQRPVVLTPESMFEDERLAGLGVTQFVIEDGWIGAALGAESPLSGGVARRLSGPKY